MANVPNAKYLAHLPHQTPFKPIYQMCHISYFLQDAIVPSHICHGTERMWHMFYSFFIPLSLSSLRQSHMIPQSSPFSPSPQSSPLKPQPSLLFHAHAHANLSLAMVFLLFFFFFGYGLKGSVLTEVGGFRWARLWVNDVGVGVMLVWVCCMGRR